MALSKKGNRTLVIVGALVVGVFLVIAGLRIKSDNHIISIGQAHVRYELASTPDALAKGLSGRTSLAADSGMLFVIDPPQKMTFWMKDMQFPLDFIWIKDSKVVDILEHVAAPLPGTRDEKLLKYEPKESVDHVLEVNAGFVEYYKIKVGDEIKEK